MTMTDKPMTVGNIMETIIMNKKDMTDKIMSFGCIPGPSLNHLFKEAAFLISKIKPLEEKIRFYKHALASIDRKISERLGDNNDR
jgi:hypothetical protein